MQEREELRIVYDQIGAPTWCRTIAQATSVVLARLPRDREARRGLCGVYHVSPSGSTSWFGFAQAIRDGLALGCTLRPIPACEYPTPARRPMNSRMDAPRLQQVFGLSMSSWEADLGLCLGERC